MSIFSEMALDVRKAEKKLQPVPSGPEAPPESRITDGPKPGPEKAERPSAPTSGSSADLHPAQVPATDKPQEPGKPESPQEIPVAVPKGHPDAPEPSRPDCPAELSDEDAVRLSTHRVRDDTERITRRNMKECVSERVQARCREDPAFARLVLGPRKSMTRCFRYIFRKAQEFANAEMESLGETYESGVYGTDVPDGVCYQWAEEYFKDPDAPEDRDKPKAAPKSSAGASKPPAKKPAEKKTKAAMEGQISLLGEAG